MKVRIAVVTILICLAGSAPGQERRTPRISPEYVESTVTSLESLIDRQYFDQTLIPKINKALEIARTAGRFSAARDLPQLVTLLNNALYEGSQDKHLWVSMTAAAAPEQHVLSRSDQSRLSNYGIRRAEILDGNIGYLKIDFFYRPSEGATDILSDAMSFLSRSDALILDLRENGGGSVETVARLLSYFFDRPDQPLFSIVERSGDVVTYRTGEIAAGLRNEKRPVYVLVTSKTWSGGEGMAFLLQEHHRATIIGEQTPGAANPAGPSTLNDYLTVNIPFGSVKSAVLNKSWEGTGVIPDVSASPQNALKIAYIDALQKLLQQTNAPAKRKLIADVLTKAEP